MFPSFLLMMPFIISSIVGIREDISASTIIPHMFIFNTVAITTENTSIASTLLSCLLLTILLNILYLLSNFNGFCFISPFLFSMVFPSHGSI